MSLTSNYFKKINITKPPKIQGRKMCRCIKKCGNCIHAEFVKAYPNDGLYNEYFCKAKKSKVTNCQIGCSEFENKHKKSIKPK